jgi:hypothetical protein
MSKIKDIVINCLNSKEYENKLKERHPKLFAMLPDIKDKSIITERK